MPRLAVRHEPAAYDPEAVVLRLRDLWIEQLRAQRGQPETDENQRVHLAAEDPATLVNLYGRYRAQAMFGTLQFAFTPDAVISPEASDRAYALLRSFLSPVQQQQWDLEQQFVVIAQSGLSYLVHPTHNVVSSAGQTYCIGPLDRATPIGDRLLTFKLWLEANEAGFLREANPYGHLDMYTSPETHAIQVWDPRVRAEAVTRPQQQSQPRTAVFEMGSLTTTVV